MALLNPSPRRTHRHAPAFHHLRQRDPVLATLMTEAGPCGLAPRTDSFVVLCESIIAQQLSPAAAETIFCRFAAGFPRRRPTPRAVAASAPAALLKHGLSRQKVSYLKDLARAFLAGEIRPARFHRQTNEEIIAQLIAVHGIGRWTAEMFLIFALNRLDVLPLGDLGIRKAVQRCYALPRLPTTRRLRSIAKAWHPYETVACWYLWRSLTRVSVRATGTAPLRRTQYP